MNVAQRAVPADGNPFQHTGQWWNDRTGCLTSSRMASALARKKDKSWAKEADDLAKEILAERLTGDIVPHYETAEMRRGTQMEPVARERYCVETGNIVRLCGFIKHPTIEFCGVSPDGLVDDDGLWEGKCPKTTTHLTYLANKVPPSDYEPQMLLQLAATRRGYVDFTSFDDRLKERKLQLFVVRFEPKPALIAEIEEKACEFLRVVNNLFDKLNGG